MHDKHEGKKKTTTENYSCNVVRDANDNYSVINIHYDDLTLFIVQNKTKKKKKATSGPDLLFMMAFMIYFDGKF